MYIIKTKKMLIWGKNIKIYKRQMVFSVSRDFSFLKVRLTKKKSIAANTTNLMNQLHEFMTISQSVPDLRQMRPCASKVMRPLTWALKNARPGRPTQAVRHKCSGNIGIVQILRYIRLY